MDDKTRIKSDLTDERCPECRYRIKVDGKCSNKQCPSRRKTRKKEVVS